MEFIKEFIGNNYYLFICEACGEKGDLDMNTKESRQFCCPRCDARYIQWNNLLTGKPDLMCVVMPIFEEEL